MRVTYDWTDEGGTEYTVDAEVHPVDRNRISIISITTVEGVDVDFDDFEDDEQMGIRWGAKEAALELDNIPDDDDEELDDDDYDRSDEELDLT